MSAVALQSFGFGDQLVRTTEREGSVWFVANDVCGALEIANASDAIRKLADDEKGVVTTDTLGGRQDVRVISESGVYCLIFKSRKPIAVTFRKWVTGEVLPALRKHGRFEIAIDEGVEPRALIPLEDFAPNLALIREARQIFPPAVVRKMWVKIGLPDPYADDGYQTLALAGAKVDESVAHWFGERTRHDTTARVKGSVLYDDYTRWAADRGLASILDAAGFGRSLTAMGIPSFLSNGTWRSGIALVG